MKAVALTRYLPISNPESLVDVELPKPSPLEHDVLVRVEAISVNPVDTKVRAPKDKQLASLSHQEVDHIANFADTDQYWSVMAELIKPQGHVVSIVHNAHPVELNLLQSRSASFHWTFMFTRSMFHTPDMEKQGLLLNQVADLVNEGKIRPTHSETLSPINAANLRSVHAKLESGRAIGKITLVGW